MKILLRYCYFWGNYTTHSLEINPDTSFNELMSKISDKFGINVSDIIIKFYREGFSVCLQNLAVNNFEKFFRLDLIEIYL